MVYQLLGAKSSPDPLTAVATWAEDQGARPAGSRRWHFVEIPLSVDRYDQARHCPDNNCVVEKINTYKNQLSSKKQNERIEALKYLVHLVGDLHQPLHCSDNNDAGGNKTSVSFFGQSTNLHKVWDGDLIDWTGLNETDYVNKLWRSKLPTANYWIPEWVNESHELARYAYKFGNDKKLGDSYYKTMLPRVDAQLARGGVRLAYVIEYGFGVLK